MRFAILSVLALAASVFAQDKPNSFNLPTGTLVFTAGQSKDLTWDNKQGNTVTLVLQQGANSDLKDVSTIASNIPNSGSYTWTPDKDLPEGSTYAIKIINDDDPSEINYTTQFVVQSDVKAVASGSSTGVVTATSASLVTSEPTAPATGSSSGSATGSSSGSATGSATGSSSGMTTRTGSASASATGSSSGSSSRSAASNTAASGASVPTTNAAAKPVIGAAGSLLAVAAGFAIAL